MAINPNSYTTTRNDDDDDGDDDETAVKGAAAIKMKEALVANLPSRREVHI